VKSCRISGDCEPSGNSSARASFTRGEARQHSDIDIAILPLDDLPSGFFAKLAADFEESTIPYDVDLVDLRRADAALIDLVRREGVKWRG
jgi:hypothetical protein